MCAVLRYVSILVKVRISFAKYVLIKPCAGGPSKGTHACIRFCHDASLGGGVWFPGERLASYV